MRHFTVYAKPFKLDDLIETIAQFDPPVLLVEDVRGYGRQKGHLELYSGSEYSITFLPKVRLEFLAPAAQERAIREAMAEAGRTGRIGDGKILVREVRKLLEL
ncbi:P-II family nitrogen regulator [Planctomycetota bacterium]